MNGKVVSALWSCSPGRRALAQEEPPGPAWKHQISLPDEPFPSWTSPPYVKFTIITKAGYDPNLVYFQDSTQYEYHFDFALECLEPFLGMTIEEFDGVTLHAAGQQAVLGAVILPPWHDPPFQEYGIQLVRTDPYTREETVEVFNLVKSLGHRGPERQGVLLPDVRAVPGGAAESRSGSRARACPSARRLSGPRATRAMRRDGPWGGSKFVPGGEIQQAYTAGDLLPDDILLTDGVPAEVPSVAGIVTLTPSTPNSHVAILARSQGVPFVHLAVEAMRAGAGAGRPQRLSGCHARGVRAVLPVKLLDVGLLDEARRGLLCSR